MKLVLRIYTSIGSFKCQIFEELCTFEYTSKEEAASELSRLIKEADERLNETNAYANSTFTFVSKKFSCLDFTYTDSETGEIKYYYPLFEILTLEEWFEKKRIDKCYTPTE